MTQQPGLMGQVPTEKQSKYDRQLRLWAEHGQTAIESAHVVALMSPHGAVVVETLKNVVLPGIGRFTLLDDSVVTEADLGNNFFLDRATLGKRRAEQITRRLLELNPDVDGDWLPQDECRLDITSALMSLSSPTLFLYTLPISREVECAIHEFSAKKKLPMIAVHCAGFYSYFRVDLPGMLPIVDTHPDATSTLDLGLLDPWPELLTFVNGLTSDLDALDDQKHGNLPFATIILYFLQEWKTKHHGRIPSNAREKDLFRSSVEAGARTSATGDREENFDEALLVLRRALVKPALPETLRDIFELVSGGAVPSAFCGPDARLPTEQQSFWVICCALKWFYDTHQRLPLSGRLPDMKSEPAIYVELQRIYKDKARDDAFAIFNHARALRPDVSLELSDVESVCRNCASMKLLQPSNRTAEDLHETLASMLAQDMHAEDLGVPPSLVPIYLALSASSYEPSTRLECDFLDAVARTYQFAARDSRVVAAAKEVARYSGGEIHSVSAATGGLVAQEIIKIVTKQYVPVDNTCVYDGINSRCQTLRL